MTDSAKVWFITGASSNFGIALTRALLDAGYLVVATARTVSKIPFKPCESLMILPLDVKDSASISNAFNKAVKQFKHIDVIVNKAGVHACGELESIPEAEARDMFDVQLWGPARIQTAAVAIFEAQKSEGLIVNISSALAVFNAPLRTMISSSKAAAEVLTLAHANTSPSISALNIRPGAFEKEPRTDFYPQLPAYASKDLGRTIAGSMRKQGAPPPGVGDVNKMALSLIALAELSQEQRPRAVSLGSDAYAMALVCAKKRVHHLNNGQRLLESMRDPTPAFGTKSARVWLVIHGASNFGHTLVPVLLSFGQRVVAVVSSRQSSPFPSDDSLLILEQLSSSRSAIDDALDSTIKRFGRVDIVVYTTDRQQSSSEDEWESARALLEQTFWQPMQTIRASVKTFRERNPPGAGGRIFTVLTTPDEDAQDSSVQSAARASLNAATTSLVRELPGKWDISSAALTIDSDLLVDDETARILLNLADVSNTALPSQLPVGPRAIAQAQHAAAIELSEVTSKGAVMRAMETDQDHIDGRARIGLTEAIFTLVLSPSPSFVELVWSILAALGWGFRLVISEKIMNRSVPRPSGVAAKKL